MCLSPVKSHSDTEKRRHSNRIRMFYLISFNNIQFVCLSSVFSVEPIHRQQCIYTVEVCGPSPKHLHFNSTHLYIRLIAISHGFATEKNPQKTVINVCISIQHQKYCFLAHRYLWFSFFFLNEWIWQHCNVVISVRGGKNNKKNATWLNCKNIPSCKKIIQC